MRKFILTIILLLSIGAMAYVDAQVIDRTPNANLQEQTK